MVEQAGGEGRDFRQVAGKAVRYALATIGPVGTAGSQFLLSLQTLHMLDAKSFGSFSFLLVLAAFSCSIWSALFCAPLPILTTTGTEENRTKMLRCLFSTNGVGAIVAGLVFFGLALSLGVAKLPAVIFAAYATVQLLRWFARQHAYLTNNLQRTVASDVLYSAVLLTGIVSIHFQPSGSLEMPVSALLAAAAASLLPFGVKYFSLQFLQFSPRDLLDYVIIWRRYSSWSLVGVATTEATANAHAYLVTSFMGPSAFAPLSASALLIRPVAVVMTALSDFERPQMAQLIRKRDIAAAGRSLTIFRLALIATWLGTGVVALVLMTYNPNLLFPAHYSTIELEKGAAIWMAIAFVRLLRTPESALLQSAGQFRPLALASIFSSVVSVAMVGALLMYGGPLLSLAGVLFGEATYALWIFRQAHIWRRSFDAPDGLASSQRGEPEIQLESTPVTID